MRLGVKSILIQAPTGSGKTALTAHMLKTAASKGMVSWFCVHRFELIQQAARAFNEEGLKFGVISPRFMPDKRPLTQIASINSLGRRMSKYRPPALIVYDESHHLGASSWQKIHASFPNAYHIGLSATPQRLDGKGLDKYFKHLILGPDIKTLIGQGYLANYKIYAPPGISVEGIHTKMGDFARSEVAAVVDKPSITGDAILHYSKYASGKRAVVFAASIEHSKNIVAQFNAAGIKSSHLDGGSETIHRNETVKAFTRGEVKVLSNVSLFSEGFDVPAIEAIINLAPTQSLTLYLQKCGRALRPFPGKECAIIFDHANDCSRHGLPDEERAWSLSGRDRKKSTENVVKIRTCNRCYAVTSLGAVSCKYCGHVFEIKPREVEHRAGELVEVDASMIAKQRQREQGTAKDLQSLIALGRQRGYKRPEAWAQFIWRARMAKKMAAA